MTTKKSNPLIYVVEDNQVYNRLIVSFLKTNKYTNVQSYLTGEDVIESLNEQKPDIVIQDYLLGGMNGIDVLKAVKAKAPHAEFIFLSGNDSIDIAINTMKYGAYDYIIKDQMALRKMVAKIERIESFKELKVTKSNYKKGIVLFFIGVAIFVFLVIAFVLSNPEYFGWDIGDIMSR